jgi:mRNA-degrading endonuclease RelE of RelBE toxin-antitoxin system
MAYQVGIRRKAQKQIDRMQERDRDRVLEDALALGDDPRPRGAAKMRGTGNLEDWRIRVGKDYRVIYRINDETREVLILEAGHRQGIYG